MAELITQLLRPQYLDSLRTLPVKYLLMVSQQTVYGPGLINTEIWKSLPKEQADAVIDGIPMGRPGEPQEVADAIVFLASKEASYITGEEIDINGGSHMD